MLSNRTSLNKAIECLFMALIKCHQVRIRVSFRIEGVSSEDLIWGDICSISIMLTSDIMNTDTMIKR